MSRTWKTNPPWVGRDWAPVHGYYCRNYLRRSWQAISPKAYRPCNLPDEPPKHRTCWDKNSYDCIWEPDLPRFYTTAPEHKRWGRLATVAVQARRMQRRCRRQWRDYRQKALASRICDEGISGCLCLYDVMNDEIPPDPRHRRFGLWDRW